MKESVFLLLLYSCFVHQNRVVSSTVSRKDFSEVKLFQKPAAYEVESTVLLNDITKKDKEIGYKIKSKLHVEPVWSDSQTEFLLKFRLSEPKLHLRGKHLNADFLPHGSVWDSYRDTTFYAHWKAGLIEAAYLNHNDLVDVLNYKKSLISLFQFQIIDGEHNETDVTGNCHILYESISADVFRKIKKQCSQDGDLGRMRRVTRYTVGGEGGEGGEGGVRAVYADELLELGREPVALKARSWHSLQPAPAPAPAPAGTDPAPARSLEAALLALPAELAPADLQLVDDEKPDDDLNLEEELEASRPALEYGGAGAGGRAPQAALALRLLPALAAAPAPALTALLEDHRNHPILTELCYMLGVAGTQAALAAVDALAHLSARDALEPPALAFLAGLSAAPAPAPAAVQGAARLAAAARAPPLARAALLAAAAAAARLPPPHADVPAALRDSIARGLARCKDDECRATHLHALGNLRREDTVELMLEHAERSGRRPALAALDALAGFLGAGTRVLHVARRQRLEVLAALPGRPLEVRAAALDLFLRASAARPLPLAGLADALHSHGPAELRRLFWQRLRQLAADLRPVAEFLPLMHRDLTSWHARAIPGTSSVLVRSTGAGAGDWRARLDSLQVAAGGLLRRALVTLRAEDTAPHSERAHDLLTVEVWTRGLEAVAGGEADPEPAAYEGAEAGDEAEVAGGLSLAVGGARLPGVQLFAGQGELLAHVWAGTGSAPTPALRALLPLAPPAPAARLPLLAGVRLSYSWRAALALALDASAQVSLWSRSARTELELRAGAAGEARAGLAPAWGRLQAVVSARAEPALRIAADVDFYRDVTFCVRTALDDHTLERESTLESRQGARGARVLRSRRSARVSAGRTLALGAANDRACRDLTPPAAPH